MKAEKTQIAGVKLPFISIALKQAYILLADRRESSAEKGNSWAWRWSFLFCCSAILISFPSYEQFFEPNQIVKQVWDALDIQAKHPLTYQNRNPELHEGQIALRLLLPSISHFTGLSMRWWFVTQHILAVWFGAAIMAFFYDQIRDKTTAILIGACFYLTYLGKAFFVDVLGYYDATAFALLLAAWIVRKQGLVFVFMLAALFVDERTYLIVPLVGFSRMWRQSVIEGLLPTWPALFRSKAIWYCVAALSLGLAIRGILYLKFGLVSGASSENLGPATLRQNYSVLMPALISGLDAMVILAGLPTLYLWRGGQKLLAGAYLVYLLAALSSCLLILDITRCTAYFFPAVLMGFWLVCHYEREALRNQIIRHNFILTLLMPPIFTVGASIVWMGPIVPKGVRLLAQLWFGMHL